MSAWESETAMEQRKAWNTYASNTDETLDGASSKLYNLKATIGGVANRVFDFTIGICLGSLDVSI